MLKFIIALLLAIGSMYWAIQGQPLSEIWEYILKADWWALGWIALIFTIQQILRSHRQMRIVQSTCPTHDFMTSFNILCVSFFFINILPLRMGESLRPMLLLEKENMPLGGGIAVVFVERMMDLLSAMIMALLVLFLANIPMLEGSWIAELRQKLLFLLPIFCAALLIPIFASTWIQKWLCHPWIPQKMQSILHNFLIQLQQLRQANQLGWIILETIIIWIISTSMYVLCAQAFGLDIIHFVEGMGLLAFTMIGMAAPSAPGFAGTYEASFVGGLQLFGSHQDSLNFAMAFCFHWWIFIVQSSSALLFMIKDGTGITDLWQKIKST